jgi:hypothetical protein
MAKNSGHQSFTHPFKLLRITGLNYAKDQGTAKREVLMLEERVARAS